MTHSLDAFFNPSAIAIVGASNTLGKIGAACADWMDSIEVNPLRVLELGQGVMALDAVITARDRLPHT